MIHKLHFYLFNIAIGIVILVCLTASDARQIMQRSKPISQPLTIQCQCPYVQCHWYYDHQQSVPDHWIQVNGDLAVPADDWSVYGMITQRCGSDNYTYIITNPGTCMHSMCLYSSYLTFLHAKLS